MLAIMEVLFGTGVYHQKIQVMILVPEQTRMLQLWHEVQLR